MKVQVFIPTFNRFAMLKKAVQSVLMQTHSNIEVVILDNHSNDDTSKLVATLMAVDSRIKYVRHHENMGMMPNFNTVRGLVDADFFSILTDDDEYEPNFVQTALNCFDKNPTVEFVACNAPTRVHGKITGSQLDNWKEGFYEANSAVLKCLSGQYPIFTNCLFKSNMKEDMVFNNKLGNIADAWFLICLFAKYNAYITKIVTGYWNNNGENASSVQKYDSIVHVDAVINGFMTYKEFCRKNNLPLRGFLKVEMIKLSSILFASDRASFEYVCKRSMLKKEYGKLSRALLWILYKIKFLRIFIKTKSMFRRLKQICSL